MPFRWGPLIRLTTLFLIAAFAPSTVGAASYQKRDGTIVDPIMKCFYVSGVSRFVPASYNGANLEPTADLTDANLNHAILVCADLTGQMSGAFYCTNNVPNGQCCARTGLGRFASPLPLSVCRVSQMIHVKMNS